ncbi:uncharacterized protein LOC141619940 [Silene latifolia]|uniref:uncharacterized protein LOC141619940 n=1 Tax=Silene latifolia TaxID=37657 RepID=UPI003D76D2C5
MRPTRCVNPDILETLVIKADIVHIFETLEMEGLYHLRKKSYPYLTLEFLSFFVYDVKGMTISFRLMNEDHELTLDEFAGHLGLEAEEEGYLSDVAKNSGAPHYLPYLTGRPAPSASAILINDVQHVSLRMFLRMITCFVFARDDNCGVEDIKAVGSFFTWTNKQEVNSRVYSRIDRALINDEWLNLFPDSLWVRNIPFRYYNTWAKSPEFMDIIKKHCNTPIFGNYMYMVVKRMKTMKQDLKNLNRDTFHDVEKNAHIMLMTLHNIQEELQLRPSDPQLIEVEQEAADGYRALDEARYAFLAQKAKVNWLEEGDDNTAFFHSAIKKRRMSNKVVQIEDENGIVLTQIQDINYTFERYYINLLGASCSVKGVHRPTIRQGTILNEEHHRCLARAVTGEEVRRAIFDIPGTKSPGPDGFNSQFFKDAWGVIGADVVAAVQDFFVTGKLLKQINNTTLTLIPKVDMPKSVNQFRPIACCNTIYKCIAKILCNRLGEDMLRALNFLEHFTNLLMECVSTPYYTLSLNEEIGDWQSMIVIMRAFNTFSAASGTLPFKYLRVPISAKKVSVLDCNILVERIVDRIRALGAKRLSYAGRLVMINSVLGTLHSYWARIYIIPICIMVKIESICRSFLWKGEVASQSPASIAWDKVCLPKTQGDLGVCDLRRWSVAVVGKYVWWLMQKKDHLWVKWIHCIYLKGESSHDYKPPQGSSWAWRRICRVKESLIAGYVGNDFQQSEEGEYTIARGYQWLGTVASTVDWYNCVWNTITIPKHQFIGWLWAQERQCVNMVNSWCHSDIPQQHLMDWWRGYRYSGRVDVLEAILLALIYHIWWARNNCRVNQVVWAP